MARPRKVPQRTCVGCGEVQGKRELLRIVRTPEGAVTLDPTGKRNGRGAYVHRQSSCLEGALRGDRLARALRCEVGPETREALRSAFDELDRAARATRPPMVHRAPVPPPRLWDRTRGARS